MDDKSALLDQLRIDRSSTSTARPSVRLWTWLGIIAVAALVAGLWFWSRSRADLTVKVVTAQAASVGSAAASTLDASGYVVARRQATVASKITDKMVELDIEEGDHVKEGQIIARLDDSNVRAALAQAQAQHAYAKASLDETQVNLANAERDYARQRRLVEGHFVSQAALDNAQTSYDGLRAQLATQQSNVSVVQRALDVAQRNVDDTIIRAPFAGVITVKAAQPGEIVSPISAGGGFTRTGIGTIVDMESLEFQIDVNENFINRVQSGQRATAKLNAYPDWQIPAHVIAVIPTADRSKGTVTVRIAIDQKDARILPEMGVRVSFFAEAAASGEPVAAGVSLPLDAVLTTGSNGIVYVIRGDHVERRAVKLGATGGSGLLVLSGLTAGERVAAGGLSRLTDGAKVRIEQ